MAAENWREFSYPEAGFSAYFPGKPAIAERLLQSSQSPGGTIMERVYFFDEGGTVYSVGIVDFTGMGADADIAVNEVAAGVTVLGKLAFDISSYINEVHGRRIVVTGGDGTSYTDGIFYNKEHLYQIKVIYPANNGDPAGTSGINQFLVNFQFLDPF